MLQTWHHLHYAFKGTCAIYPGLGANLGVCTRNCHPGYGGPWANLLHRNCGMVDSGLNYAT